ncbi:hypothetical protein Cus16_0409 [Curtobacterium sp. ER1/6]|nr:hypothetical protein Cus16_0409 [Curtobacterium sp. ER1/6]
MPGQPERPAEGRTLVVGGPVHAAFLQQRDDAVDEVVEAVRVRVRDDDEPVARPFLHVPVDLGGDRRRGADEAAARRDLDHELPDGQVLGGGPVAPGPHERSRVLRVPHAAARDRVGVDVRFDVGQWAVDVVRGQVTVPDLLEERDRGGRADLRPSDRPGALLGVGLRVADGEGRAGQDQEFVLAAADTLQSVGDVGVEGARVVELGVQREDHLGVPGGEVAALVGVPGLHDDRVPLRAARDRERAGDVELRAVVVDVPDAGPVGEPADRRIGDDGTRIPRVPELARQLDELGRPGVPVGVVEEATAPEVRAVERVRARHDVPAGPPVAEVVERRELLRELERLVERRLQRADETDVVGDPGQGGQDRERVRTTDHVEVVDAALLLAEPQPLGEEQEVEAPALGVPREVLERRERDLALGPLVAPHGGVVDAREVGGEVDLTLAGHAETSWDDRPDTGRSAAYRLTAGAMPSRVRRSAVGREATSARSPAVTSAGTSRRAMAVESIGVRSGRSRTPAYPSARRSPIRSTRSATVVARTVVSEPDPTAYGVPAAASSAASASAASAADDPMSTARSARTGRRRSEPAACSASRTSARVLCASRPSKPGVTSTTSAVWTAKATASARWASAKTGGRPCGDRGTIDAPCTETCSPTNSAPWMRSRSMKRPVVTSRMIASSSQLSQRRLTTSATSRASAKRTVVSSPPGRRPNSAASRVVGLTWIRHPARPSETWSRVWRPVATWKGSVCVTETVGTSPIERVAGATALTTSRASSRPTTVLVSRSPLASTGPAVKESSTVTASMPRRSCSTITSRQWWRPVGRAAAAPGTRQAAGCQPLPWRAVTRTVRSGMGCVLRAGRSITRRRYVGRPARSTTVAARERRLRRVTSTGRRSCQPRPDAPATSCSRRSSSASMTSVLRSTRGVVTAVATPTPTKKTAPIQNTGWPVTASHTASAVIGR